MQLPHLVSAPGDAQVSSSKRNHKMPAELVFKCSWENRQSHAFSKIEQGRQKANRDQRGVLKQLANACDVLQKLLFKTSVSLKCEKIC